MNQQFHDKPSPTIQPDIELSASFSQSSSQQNEHNLLNMSDILALCDADVKLTIEEIKQIFKGLVNKISQLELNQAIRQGNLRMGEDAQRQRRQKQQKERGSKTKRSSKKGENKDEEQDDENDKESLQFNMEILEKKSTKSKSKSNIENKKQKRKASSISKQKNSTKPIQGQSDSNLRKEEIKKPTLVSEIVKRVKELESQVTKINQTLKSLNVSTLINEKTQQEQQLPSNTSIQQINKYQQAKIFTFSQDINSKYFQTSGQKLQKIIAKYIGPNDEQTLFCFSTNQYINNQEFTVKILKTSHRNILIGIANKLYLGKRSPLKDDDLQCLFYHGQDGTISQNCKIIKHQWNGFNEGDMIQVKIQEKQGKDKEKVKQILWIINGIVRATYISGSLLREDIIWIPCAILSSTGDIIEVK